MSLLESLKLTDLSRRSELSPIGRFRRRLISAIETQIEIAKADAAGQTLNLMRKRRVKDEATGRTEVKEVPANVRRWWWRDVSGGVHLSIKSGGKTLELAPGRNAIEVGAIDELPAKLALVCDAVRAGELDHCALARAPAVIALSGASAATPASGGKKAAGKSAKR